MRVLGATLSLAHLESELVVTWVPGNRLLAASVLDLQVDFQVLKTSWNPGWKQEPLADLSCDRALNADAKLTDTGGVSDVDMQSKGDGVTLLDGSWICFNADKRHSCIVIPSWACLDELAEVDWVQVGMCEGLDEYLDASDAADEVAGLLRAIGLEVRAKLSASAQNSFVQGLIDEDVQRLPSQLEAR